jgi:hypothetical protein
VLGIDAARGLASIVFVVIAVGQNVAGADTKMLT